MKHVEDSSPTQVVMPLADLHGRTVWTEAGDRVGTVRDVQQDDDGRIVSLSVRERWMLGKHREVSAAGMRMDQGDVIVPSSSVALERDGDTEDRSERRDRVADRQDRHDRVDGHDRGSERRPVGRFAHAPVLLAGREGARSRFGGIDVIGSLFGALVAIASLVIIGGVLGAIFGSDPAQIDTSLDSLESILTETLIVAAATIFLSCFLGGWAAGRSARFDGVANGMMTVVWVLAIGAALAAVGAWLGDEYDVFANSDLPQFVTDDFALLGSVAFVAALVLMLIGGALGGALGESWHRRADRAMLDVVSVEDHAPARSGVVGSPAAERSIDDDDDDDVPVIRSDRRPR
ncbi:MAG: hypothetical protein JWL76_1770 [Thermoleophilia bacterium]|nr:hypothetical protein [Thermoleophilia bacterium]